MFPSPMDKFIFNQIYVGHKLAFYWLLGKLQSLENKAIGVKH